MRTRKYIVSILFAALSCAATSVLATPDQKCDERVLLTGLVTNPDAYHGKTVWVVAYVTIEFENMTACPSEKDAHAKNCVWLDMDDGPYKTDQDYARYQSKLRIWERFDRQTVAIRATFDKNSKGHFSMWPGTLRNVKEMSGHQGGWNFISHLPSDAEGLHR